MQNEVVLKNKFGMGYVKIHGFRFENGGMPTNVLISQLLLILDC